MEFIKKSHIGAERSIYDGTVNKKRVIICGKEAVLTTKTQEENVNNLLSLTEKDIGKEFKYYVDGLLLGDGSINNTNTISKYYEHKTISLNWLNHIKSFFEKYNIPTKIYRVRAQHKLYTKANPVFTWFRNRWYKEKENKNEYFKYEKILPNNLDLTPVCVANWYMGDGSLLNPNKYTKQHGIKLSTHSFNQEDVYVLANCLNSFLHTKFTVIKETSTYSIYDNDFYYTLRLYGNDNVKLFLDYIKPYVINDYSYKYEPFYKFIGG